MRLQLMPQSGSQASEQLIHAERFGDIIIGPEIKGLNLAGLIPATRQNHDWDAFAARAYHSQQIVSLNVRKPEIEDDQIRIFYQ
jgi:hypothetical protein